MKKLLGVGLVAAGTYIAFSGLDTPNFSLTKDPKTNIRLVKAASNKIFGIGIVANTAAAQAILESNLYGKPSSLARNGNNLFGVKYNPKVDSNYITLGTSECAGSICGKVVAKFAKYDSILDSFKALNRLYNKANHRDVFKAKTCLEASTSLKKGGYATDPNYAQKVATICVKIQKNLI